MSSNSNGKKSTKNNEKKPSINSIIKSNLNQKKKKQLINQKKKNKKKHLKNISSSPIIPQTGSSTSTNSSSGKNKTSGVKRNYTKVLQSEVLPPPKNKKQKFNSTPTNPISTCSSSDLKCHINKSKPITATHNNKPTNNNNKNIPRKKRRTLVKTNSNNSSIQASKKNLPKKKHAEEEKCKYSGKKSEEGEKVPEGASSMLENESARLLVPEKEMDLVLSKTSIVEGDSKKTVELPIQGDCKNVNEEIQLGSKHISLHSEVNAVGIDEEMKEQDHEEIPFLRLDNSLVQKKNEIEQSVGFNNSEEVNEVLTSEMSVVNKQTEMGDNSDTEMDCKISTLHDNESLHKSSTNELIIENAWGPTFGLRLDKSKPFSDSQLKNNPLNIWYLSRGHANFIKHTSFPGFDHILGKQHCSHKLVYTNSNNPNKCKEPVVAGNKEPSAHAEKADDIFKKLTLGANWRSWYPLEELEGSSPGTKTQILRSVQVLNKDVVEVSEANCENIMLDRNISAVEKLKHDLSEERRKSREFNQQLMEILKK